TRRGAARGRDLDGSRLPVQLEDEALCHFRPLSTSGCRDVSDEVNTGEPAVHDRADGRCGSSKLGSVGGSDEWPFTASVNQSWAFGDANGREPFAQCPGPAVRIPLPQRGFTNHRCRRWEKITLLTRPGATPIP